VVLLATVADAAAGCVVLTRIADEVELKRLWVAPAHRGRGVATALARRALADAGGLPVRLSVWHWRTDAIGLYERLGFAEVEPWDARPGLVCLRRPA
jgi:putative acetyltransferase